MFARAIISQNEDTYFDLEALVVGEDEAAVLANVNKLFREIVKDKDGRAEVPLNDEDIEDCVKEGSYVNLDDKNPYEVYIFAPNKFVVLNSEKEFENVEVQDQKGT
jgi:hypothetical protein